MSGTYADVDGSADPAQAVFAQEAVDAWPQIRAYKRHTYALLDGLSPVLDVGCGPGLDLVELGPDIAVGIDASRAMCIAARTRGAAARATVYRLPFVDERFGGVRADRVLQHLEDPTECLHELVRVCRPGGRVVVADPDQGTLSITVPGVPQETADRVAHLRREIGYKNGHLVATLPAAFIALGLREVRVDAFPLLLRAAEQAFGLTGWPRLWREQGGFSDDEINTWERATATEPVVYALIYLVVAATKP